MDLENLFFEDHPNAMLIYDRDSLEIKKVNRRFIEKYGYSKTEARGLSFEDLLPEEDRSALQIRLAKLGQQSKVYENEPVRHLSKSGDILYVQITSQYYPIDNMNTRIVHIHDLTETVTLKNKYKNTLDELNHHIDENPLAMIKFDHEFKIIYWSKRSEEKFGYRADEVLGKTSFDFKLFPEEEHNLIKEQIQKLTDGRLENTRFETFAFTKNGFEINIRINASSLRTSQNKLKSVVAFVEDITLIRRNEMLLKTTEEMAKIGGWEYNPNNDELYWTDQIYQIYGISRDHRVDLQKALEFYIEGDKDRIKKDLNHAIDNRQSYDAQYQLVTADGSRKWVRAMGRPIMRNKRLFKVMGILQDITEQKNREEEIHRNAKEKEVLLAEIHHRVKNNLAIISGLLELKALKEDNEKLTDILRQSQLRIQSMAMIHEALYEAEDFTNLEFSNFVKNLISTIKDAHGYLEKDIHIDIETTEHLKLNVNQAIPSGLIINELVTNAFKHAFKDNEEGLLKIGVDYNDEDNEVILKVEDNGKGLPESFIRDESDTLGATLIHQLASQLGGLLDIQNKEGAFVEVRFRKNDKSGSSSQNFNFN